MNSQKKQSSRAGIKTDKYGVPLNYGNYKNGRLVVKKSGGGRGGGGRGGGSGRGGRGSNGKATNGKSKHDSKRNDPPTKSKTKKGQQQQQKQHLQSNLQKQPSHLKPVASVGLTGEAHNVIKEALLTSSNSNTNLQQLMNDNATSSSTNPQHANALFRSSGNGNTNANANNSNPGSSIDNKNLKNNQKLMATSDRSTTTETATTTTNNNNNRHRRSSPDMNPPSIIIGKDPMGPMGEQRRGLPVYNFKNVLLKTIATNKVTVVEGETGSGKTTQVPQFCLEDAASQGLPCNIIIAQPRRISAMSVAERVAAERGEKIGKTVGYTIRLESKATTNTRLLFCTTGILLKRLEEDPTLQNITHVFVDEVHERSIESDFLLMVLRDMLPKRSKDRPLKVVLMSATLDASLFHDYFWGAPSVKFPGRTYPVTELYLEDALEVTKHMVKGNEDWCRKGGRGGAKKNDSSGGSKGPPEHKNGNKRSSGMSVVVPLEDRDDMELTSQELSTRYARFSSNTQAGLSKLDHNAINYSLVVDTIQWLCNLKSPLEASNYLNGSKGITNKNKEQQQHQQNNGSNFKTDTTSSAILVFLPGIKEITTLQELLIKSMKSSAAREWVLPIHSTIPPEEQRLVFTRPPKGVRKIVLATNIAETAITIDDVSFVVDVGRMKENRYDPLKRMSSLEDCLVARSNARQRRGRAGRVQEGVSVHLFTKHRHEKIALAAQAPEVQRVPLEQLVLRIKALQYPGTAAEVCARLVEPPAPEAVQRAVEELVFLEALTVNTVSNKELLTPLGVHLSTLPVDCRIGKLILLGAMFGVTDDALTIAATLSYRNPFMSPMSVREEADRAKMKFATAQSDHLTVLNAYKQVDAMGKARYDFCRENFLSIKTIQTISGLKRQLLELLSAAGFVRPNLRSRAVEAFGRRNGGNDGVALALEKGLGSKNGGDSDWKCIKCKTSNFARNTRCFKCKVEKPIQTRDEKAVETDPEETNREILGADDANEFEKSLPLLKALLVAALFPQIVIVDDGKSKGGKKGGGGGITLKARRENNGDKQEDMALHPSCITGKSMNALSSKYLVYHERVKTTRVYIRDATPVSPYALILFGGGRMIVESCPTGINESVLRLDGWLGFKCPRRDHLLVMELREVLDAILKHKVENPKANFTEESAGIIDAVKAILTMDEDGKVMVPEKRIEKAYDLLNQRNRGDANRRGGGKSGGKGRGERSGGGKRGRR